MGVVLDDVDLGGFAVRIIDRTRLSHTYHRPSSRTNRRQNSKACKQNILSLATCRNGDIIYYTLCMMVRKCIRSCHRKLWFTGY